MKKTILVALFTMVLGFSTQVQSQERELSHVQMCNKYYDIAATIMIERQAGAPMPDVIAMFPSESPLAIAMVRDAFNVPRYSTHDMRLQAVNNFAENIYSMCLGWDD